MIKDTDRAAYVIAMHTGADPADAQAAAEELTGSYRTIEVGDTVGGPLAAVVMAVQYVNGSGSRKNGVGTVLAYSAHKREYYVWTASPQGEVDNSTITFDFGRALAAFSTRQAEHLYSHFNTRPPTLTFAHVAERDRLTDAAQ
jgi:hypothetical protein